MTDIVKPMSSLKNAAKKHHSQFQQSERGAVTELVRAARAREEGLTGPDGLYGST